MQLNPDDIVDFVAVRWVDFGRISQAPFDKVAQALAEIGLDSERDLYGAPEEVINVWMDALDAIDEYRLLPPVAPGFVRVNHSVLHGDSPTDRWQIIDSILQHGLQPQPKGRGRHSELPSAIFGVVDDPDAKPIQSRRYNPYMPWVIADVPLEPHVASRPGNVAVLYSVPREYIVAINGLPVERFARAYARFGRLGEPKALSNPKPRIRSPLRKGTLVYHGTSASGAFRTLQGPAWVSDSFYVAKWFAHRLRREDDDTPSRVFTFRTMKSPKLAIVLNSEEWKNLIEWATSEEPVTYDATELAETLCGLGIDGWHIPHNYPEGSDTLLCEPEAFLEFVSVEIVGPICP